MKEEVQHAAVCVEARPPSVVVDKEAAFHMTLSQLTESFTEYNVRKSSADEELAECFSTTQAVLYGTLSHTHMSLCLRAFKIGAKWKIAGASELGFNACDGSGRLSVAAVADVEVASNLSLLQLTESFTE